MALSAGVLLYTDSMSLLFMVVAGFIFGCVVSFFWPAITALMGDILEPAQRGNGTALFQVSLNLTRSFAPFIASGLLAIAVLGSGGAYLFIALLILPVLVTAAAQPATRVIGTAGTTMMREVVLGLEHVRSRRALLEAMVGFILVTLLGFSIMVVLPGFTKDTLGAGDSGFGIIFGVNAIGALAASLVAASMADSKQLPRLLLLSGIAFGGGLALTGLMPNFALALLAMLLAGAAGAGYQTLILARMLTVSEPAYFGRVMSLTNFAWSFTSLLGLAAGILADLSSERAVLVGVGLLLVLSTLWLQLWSRADKPAVAALGPA
jgi:MFS family permease